jgi:hypothetical protein
MAFGAVPTFALRGFPFAPLNGLTTDLQNAHTSDGGPAHKGLFTTEAAPVSPQAANRRRSLRIPLTLAFLLWYN